MAGYRVKYTLASKLVNELVEAADEMVLSKTIARYGRVDLLMIDELDYMALDRRGAELLFQVLTEREEKSSVAVASNESFSKAHMFAGPRPSQPPASARRSSTDSRSAATSSRPEPTPTAWPTPEPTSTCLPLTDGNIRNQDVAVWASGDVKIHEQVTPEFTSKATLRSFVLVVLAGTVITLMTRMQHTTENLGVKLVPAILFGSLLAGGQLFHSVLDSLFLFVGLHSGSHFGYLDWLEPWCGRPRPPCRRPRAGDGHPAAPGTAAGQAQTRAEPSRHPHVAALADSTAYRWPVSRANGRRPIGCPPLDLGADIGQNWLLTCRVPHVTLVLVLDSAVVDDLDRLILGALQLNGRASWQLIARVLGTSETTVARRVQRLTDAGLLRVVGVVDVFRCGLGVPVLVRFMCRPGNVEEVAAALVERPHTRFVTVVTGSADVVAEFVVPSRSELHHVLSAGLADIGGVGRAESSIVLRTFTAAHDWNPRLLPAEAERVLRPAVVPPFESAPSFAGPETLDQLDLAIVGELVTDGRRSYAELAAGLSTGESTIARRLESLVGRGCIRFRTLAEPTLLGFDIEVMVWLRVAPQDISAVGEQLAKHPAVKYLVATAGSYQLVGRVALMSHEDLYEFNTTVLGGLTGIRDAELTVELGTLKRSWALTSPALRRAAGSAPAGGRPRGKSSKEKQCQTELDTPPLAGLFSPRSAQRQDRSG
jgi:DNA-binding Lrp family transcriptional regulator